MSNKPIAPIPTPDPWVIHHHNTYYFTFTLGSHIEIWSSPSLEDFHNSNTTRKSTVWRPPPSEHWSSDLWAPELHNLSGIWYIYTCAAPKAIGNPGHRTVLLRSYDADPMNADAWTFLGPLQGLPDDQWSIDATVFTLPHPTTGAPRLYCCYSGWPLGDHSDTQQDLFLIELRTPELAIPESLTCISRAQLDWERPENGSRGVNEGPSFLKIPPCHALPSGFQGIVFSAHGSWGPEYKLAILALVNAAEPCRESSWVKRPIPLLVSDRSKGPPYGPGHASFVGNGGGGGGREEEGGVFCVYHATTGLEDRWDNRYARVLRLDAGCFRPDALPVCCAGGMLGGGGIGWHAGPPPAEMGPGPVQMQGYGVASGTGGLANAMPVGHTPGTGGKVWGEIEKRVPGQYKGYLDKVKKWF